MRCIKCGNKMQRRWLKEKEYWYCDKCVRGYPCDYGFNGDNGE